MNLVWIVEPLEVNQRLLTFIKQRAPSSYSVADIRWCLDHNHCFVNHKVERFGSRKVKIHDRVEIHLTRKTTYEKQPQRILYEDDNLLAYDKPANISSTDLANLLELPLVHRLDRDTTGVILFPKQKEFQKYLESLFFERQINKSYLALVSGAPQQESGIIENYMAKMKQIEGKVYWGVVGKHKGCYAKTVWHCEKKGKSASLLRCDLFTGRTHQIRVHMQHIGHPLLGDADYGSKEKNTKFKFFRPLLHAEKVSFFHPIQNKELTLLSPLPQDFQDALSHLKISLE